MKNKWKNFLAKGHFMSENFFILLRINSLIDRMKDEKNIECRKVDYAGLKSIIGKFNELNSGNALMKEKSVKLLQHLKWLAHIDHPGHDDTVYMEGINRAVSELRSDNYPYF